MARLIRPRQGRILAGVCAGIADRFGCSVIPVRILTILAAPLLGFSVGVYLVLWILIPDEP